MIALHANGMWFAIIFIIQTKYYCKIASTVFFILYYVFMEMLTSYVKVLSKVVTLRKRSL